MPTQLELLSPAKNADIAIEAIKHGADAVYIGAPKFGARATAGNEIADIAKVVEFAHIYNAKVYATVNTIIYDSELKEAEHLIKELYRIGTDALIVQDMGILRLDIPPIALHASTQCDTRTAEKAIFLEKSGFSQIVLARELTINEIANICAKTNAAIECFVHGALCVSYSGRCHASHVFKGRSANRGECSQICRLPYNVYDGNKLILQNKHLLSLQDLNQSDYIEDLANAGVSSFKIEGRMKDMCYVKNITAYYNNKLNELCRKQPDKYQRASNGKVDITFTPVPEKSFNRGFTHFFLDNRQPAHIASINTPKSIGEKIGPAIQSAGNSITVNSNIEIHNGDGLIFFNENKELTGFRANKACNNTITPFEKAYIPKGSILYRNFDKQFNDMLTKETAERKLRVSIKMSCTPLGILSEMTDETGSSVAIHTLMEKMPANTNQAESRQRTLGKMGGTPFLLDELDSGNTSDLFIPASVLTNIRRTLADKLTETKRINYKFKYRGKEYKTAKYPEQHLSFADNVSNRLAKRFYTEHGVTHIDSAMETSAQTEDNSILMTTRYCIRRELNCCLKSKNKDKLGKNITLKSGNIIMSVEFDCKNCQMLLRKSADVN